MKSVVNTNLAAPSGAETSLRFSRFDWLPGTTTGNVGLFDLISVRPKAASFGNRVPHRREMTFARTGPEKWGRRRERSGCATRRRDFATLCINEASKLQQRGLISLQLGMVSARIVWDTDLGRFVMMRVPQAARNRRSDCREGSASAGTSQEGRGMLIGNRSFGDVARRARKATGLAVGSSWDDDPPVGLGLR